MSSRKHSFFFLFFRLGNFTISFYFNTFLTGNKFTPLLIFKENASNVDTPGIGESREMTAKLLDYLSEAVAFIYVINTTNGGGVQNDKVILLY